MEENRDENKKILKQKKSLIIKQISTAKSKVPKYLDDIEEKLITVFVFYRVVPVDVVLSLIYI
jgi:hypothetical protein